MIEGSRKDRHKKRNKDFGFRKIISYIFVLLLLAGISFSSYLVYLAFTIDDVTLTGNLPSSAVYSRNNTAIAIIDTSTEEYVSIGDISPDFINAVVAVEDNVFFSHPGINPIGIARALYTNIVNRRIVQGGSTITQQLAKNIFLTHERTLDRKLKELVYTFKLEYNYSKEEILEAYLNNIYYGHGNYGIMAATNFYFGKHPRDLTLDESALLAGIIQGPYLYSPMRAQNIAPRPQNTEDVFDNALDEGIRTSRTYQRRNFVLHRMLNEGYITRDQLNQANEQGFPQPREHQEGANLGIPQFVLNELEALEEQLGFERGQLRTGHNIYTTIDEDAQTVAQQTVRNFRNYIAQDKRNDQNIQAAIVAVDPNGAVLAMAGGWRTLENTRQQPGSAFKPIAYALALESQNYTLAHQHLCSLETGTFADHVISDAGDPPYHDAYLTMRQAMIESCNVYAVLTNSFLGPRNVIEMARRLGYRGGLANDLQMVLGSNGTSMLDMARAYSVFANGGYSVELYSITEIQDSYGNTIYRRPPRIESRVLSAETSFLITDMLRDVIRSPQGTARFASNLIPNRDVAIKTGTTRDYAYSAGYTPEMVTMAYIGFDEPTGQSLGIFGGPTTSRMWADFTNQSLNRMLGENVGGTFTVPDGIVEVTLCADTLLLATPNCPNTFNEYFAEGTQPQDYCNIHQNYTINVPICTTSWQLATDFCPVDEVRTFSIPANTQIQECQVHTRRRR